ncbi:MAG: hypothetical protein AABY68_12975 [Pseudomonadota bacterium]
MKFIGKSVITQGNLNNNHLYLRAFINKFPNHLIGGKNKISAAIHKAKVHADGNIIETDIDGEKGIFRARSWVRNFLKNNQAKRGDHIAVYEIFPNEYLVKIVSD